MILLEPLTTAQLIVIVSVGGSFLLGALAIIFNPMLNSKLKKIERSEISSHKEITDSIKMVSTDVKEIKTTLNDHTKVISHYVSEKEIITSLEIIRRDALKYNNFDKEVTVFIDLLASVTIDVMQEILDISLKNVNEEQLKTKLLGARTLIYNHQICNEDAKKYINKFRQHRSQAKYAEHFLYEILDISKDTVNSKTERFRVISEAFMQNLMRDAIVIWLESINSNSNDR